MAICIIVDGEVGGRKFSKYTGHTLKNGAVSKVNKKYISHLTRAQRAPLAAAA
jgi:hypothetical protein